MSDTIIERSKELESYIIEKRRDFHKNPEIKFEEERTSKVVKEELEKLGYSLEETAGTGVIATLKGGKEGKTVALRADMDALELQEENDVLYKSQIDGKMHACGHDAHTAMMLGAAKILSEMKDELEGTVKLVFQPGEEGGAGAKKILDEGKLKDIDAIFGIHVWSNLPSGSIASSSGPVMASSDSFFITIKGDGGHAAYPHQTHDPTIPANAIYDALQKIVTSNIDPLSPAVIKVPKVKTSDAYNVIPDKVEMNGTVRTFDLDVREKIIERIKQISEHYAKAWDCDEEFELERNYYPPTVNEEEMSEFAEEVAKEYFEKEGLEKQMGAEDFAFYLQEKPGCFLFIGTGNEEKGTDYPHHHPKFDVDEDELYKGTALYTKLAVEYLKQH
ncbi:MAG: M20 family metallopeptidase [Thermoplasmata archaeon]